LAFLATVPVAAPAAVELLLPMISGNGDVRRNGAEEARLQEQCVRKKTVAAEWDGLFYPATVIYSASRNLRQISAVHGEVETAGLIQPSTCQHASTAASTTRGNQGNRADYFSPMRGTCGQTLSTAGTCGRWVHHASSLGRVKPSLQRMM
jgi:hypothetical protein